MRMTIKWLVLPGIVSLMAVPAMAAEEDRKSASAAPAQ
jgi:hypothetical protein